MNSGKTTTWQYVFGATLIIFFAVSLVSSLKTGKATFVYSAYDKSKRPEMYWAAIFMDCAIIIFMLGAMIWSLVTGG